MSRLPLIFSLILLVISFDAFAEDDPSILNYSFHNQIQGSILTLKSSGIVVITERTCCVPNSVTMTTKLSPDLMLNFAKLVTLAKLGQLTIQAGMPTSPASLFGEFILNDGGDQPIVIEKVERNPILGQPDKVTINTSPAAKSIKELVDALVTTKMPTLFFFTLPKQILQSTAPIWQY